MELSHQMLLIADFLRKLFFEHYLLRFIGNVYMIIKKLTNFIGGKIMKTKIINTSSTTDVVEILLMVGNLGVESPNMALNRADAPATKGL